MEFEFIRTETAGHVADVLKNLRKEWQDSHIMMPAWPVLDRLIDRTAEMTPVWENIARQRLTGQQCYTLLQQLVFAGRDATGNRNMQLKEAYRQLKELNLSIRSLANQLSQEMRKRENILNHNGFIVDTTSHIVDLINEAARRNGQNHSYILGPLESLQMQYGNKYWPEIPAVLDVIGSELPEIEFTSAVDRSIISARGRVLPDYLRVLFSNIEDARKDHWGLPAGFTLTDASLASLAMVTLDFPEDITPEAVKQRRTEFSKAGLRGAWPHRSSGGKSGRRRRHS